MPKWSEVKSTMKASETSKSLWVRSSGGNINTVCSGIPMVDRGTHTLWYSCRDTVTIKCNMSAAIFFQPCNSSCAHHLPQSCFCLQQLNPCAPPVPVLPKLHKTNVSQVLPSSKKVGAIQASHPDIQKLVLDLVNLYWCRNHAIYSNGELCVREVTLSCQYLTILPSIGIPVIATYDHAAFHCFAWNIICRSIQRQCTCFITSAQVIRLFSASMR
jgi:hypothetical protein